MEKTKEYFENNADSFSGSRSWLWPELDELKKYLQDGEKILDLGCGNGRLFELFKDKNVEYLGVDSSLKFIEIAKKKYGDYFKVADAFNLPFSDSSFDSVWSIAFLHHVPSKQLRIMALSEIKRILKPGGKVIITCWNLYRSQYLKLLLKFTFRKLFGLSKLDFKDILLSPKRLKIQRYYHAFTKKELKKLFEIAGLKIEELRYLKRNGKKTNILIIATKQ